MEGDRSTRGCRLGDSTGAIEATLEWAIDCQGDGVVALGLGGNEVNNPSELFEEVFRHAKAHGLRVWPHAGETQGPASVWGAVHALGAPIEAQLANAARETGVDL